MKNQSMLAGLCALTFVAMATACSDDDKWGKVDGAQPTLELTSEHLHSDTGHSISIAGKISDADGISRIDLSCPEMQLDKSIDIIAIYGEPLKEYELNYAFPIREGLSGDDFNVVVRITDVTGAVKEGTLRVSLDGDFDAPVFEVSPSATTTVLIKEKTQLNLKFKVTDNVGLDHVTIDVEGAAGFPTTVELQGQKELEFQQLLVLPSTAAEYKMNIVAFDKPDTDGVSRQTEVHSIITVSELPDFKEVFLADVENASELNSDVFGVPVVCDHVAPYTYRARYYNEKAGTKICFIPQKSDFSPICFGPSNLDPQVLGDNPEEVGRITLDKAGVYYCIDFNIKSGSYSLSTYSIAEAVDPVQNMHYGADDLNTWWETNPANMDGIWWQEWYFGPADGPGGVTRMEQDAKNPHIYIVDNWKLQAGDELNFILHNWHSNGWWNFTTWRCDNSSDPSKFSYYGNYIGDTPHYTNNAAYFDFKYRNIPAAEYQFMYPKAPGAFDLDKWSDEGYRKNFVDDNWTKPVVARTGTYRLIFDAHTERARLVLKK